MIAMMRCRHAWLGGVLAVLVVGAVGCDSGSHPKASSPSSAKTSTTPKSDAGSSPTTKRPTGTTSTAPAGVTPAGCTAPADPEAVAGLPQPDAWIQMVSDGRGYAVMGREIVGTVDGRSWHVLDRMGETLGFVDAVDADHVWAVGTRSLFASTDGGVRWTNVSKARALTMVHFTDAHRGWAVGDRKLLSTDNGGRSWRVITTPCPVDRTCFDRSQHGWIATIGAVYETHDAGADWSRVLTLHDDSTAGGIAADLQCSPGDTAWVLFDGYGGATGNSPYVGARCERGECVPVVRQNFFAPEVAGIDGPGSYPGPFSVIDDHTAVFVGNTPPADQPMSMILLSDDGLGRGPRLTIPDGSAQQASARAVSFTSPDRGWIVDSIAGTSFHILATADGGKTWTRQFGAPQT